MLISDGTCRYGHMSIGGMCLSWKCPTYLEGTIMPENEQRYTDGDVLRALADHALSGPVHPDRERVLRGFLDQTETETETETEE